MKGFKIMRHLYCSKDLRGYLSGIVTPDVKLDSDCTGQAFPCLPKLYTPFCCKKALSALDGACILHDSLMRFLVDNK